MAPDVRVSAALIVRDEDAFIEGCLASIAGFVDEIVVVDTGSTDRTLEIVEKFPVVLLHRQWRDDFSWARNEGLAAATGDWILYIDADERLTVPAGRNLRDGLASPDVIAARVQFHPRVNSTPYREYRLFRNDTRIRFRNTMHETMLPDIRAWEAAGGRIIDSDVAIQHLGYEGDQTRKHVRNARMLRAAIETDPGRLYYWHHLAQTLAALSETEEALSVCAEAWRLFGERDLTLSDRAIMTLLLNTYARLLFRNGQDGLPYVEAGLRLYPNQPQLLLLEARALLDSGATEKALAILAPLASTDPDHFADPILSHDRRIFDVYAPDLMGVALLRLGRRAEAAAAFEQAARGAPDDLSYRVKAAALRPA